MDNNSKKDVFKNKGERKGFSSVCSMDEFSEYFELQDVLPHDPDEISPNNFFQIKTKSKNDL